MNTRLTPYRPVHPGELLKDEIEARHITQKRLSEVLSIPYTMLNEIVNCKRPISPDMAIALEAALEIPAYVWSNMQNDYDLQVAQSSERNISRFEAIRKLCASVLP